MLKSKQLATLLGIGVLLVVFVVGLLSAMYLINVSQDIRQQASTYKYVQGTNENEIGQVDQTSTQVLPPATNTLLSDLNADGQVNLDDFNILRVQLMTSNPTPAQTDITQDGKVDIFDFSYLNMEFVK